jgi:hypothetical protein
MQKKRDNINIFWTWNRSEKKREDNKTPARIHKEGEFFPFCGNKILNSLIHRSLSKAFRSKSVRGAIYGTLRRKIN